MWWTLAVAAAADVALEPSARWVEDWRVPLAGQELHLHDGIVFPVTADGVEAGFVYVGPGKAHLAVGTSGEALAIGAPLGDPALVRDGRWTEAVELAVVIGRGPVLNAPPRTFPPIVAEDQVVYRSADGREEVVVGAMRPSRARNQAEAALAERSRALAAVGLDPALMITLDAHHDELRWLAALRTGHDWRQFLDPGGDNWLALSHDPSGAADDSFVDRWFVHHGAAVRVLGGIRPVRGFDGARAEQAEVNVVIAQAEGGAFGVELEALLRVVADTPTSTLALAIPRGDEGVIEGVVQPGAGFVLHEVSVDGRPLERLGPRFGRALDGSWETGTWRLPAPLAAGETARVRVRWADRWAGSHPLDVKAFAVERLLERGACDFLEECAELVAQFPEWVELGRVAAARPVVPQLPDRPGAWPVEVRVGTTLPGRWEAGLGGGATRDAADGRWWVSRTVSTARVSFGDLSVDTTSAIAGFPAVRFLNDGPAIGSPAFLRAALSFYRGVLPPYPYEEVVVVSGQDLPAMGRVAPPPDDPVWSSVRKAVALGDPDRAVPRVEAAPGQIVVHGVREIGTSGTGSAEAVERRTTPRAVARGIVGALATHWWDRPAYAERDRWIARIAGWYRDRFLEEAWPDEAGTWDTARRTALVHEVARGRWVPLVGADADRAETLTVGVVHALAARIGEARLLEGLDHFLRGGVPTTEALRDQLSTVSGVDLTAFFDAWVIAGVRPEVRGTWSERGGRVTVELATDVPFGVIEVPVGLVTPQEVRIGWVQVVDGRGQAELQAPGRLERVEVDPHHWLPLRARDLTAAR